MSRSRVGKSAAVRDVSGGGPRSRVREQDAAPQSPASLAHVAGNQATAHLLGGGFPLPAALQKEFEPLFGADLSGVRLHTGSQAEAAAESERARAFTLGSDVVFSKGRYAPGTAQGKQLLAHELTHVLQQSRGTEVRSAPEHAEAEAGRAGELVGTGASLPVSSGAAVGIQRDPEDDDEKIKRAPAAKKGKAANKKPTRRSAKKAPEPEIVGEYQGVPIKRYPPGPGPKQESQVHVKPQTQEDLPEGTHQVTRKPPGSGKVRPETESGIWAHNNYEKLEDILLGNAENLTSEELRPGLLKEERVPDTRLPVASRPRMDRVDQENAEVLEIKPSHLKQQGQAEADYYAEQMNKFSKRTDGKQWKGRCITYDENKVITFLRVKGYLEPAAPKGKGKGVVKGKGAAKATTKIKAGERLEEPLPKAPKAVKSSRARATKPAVADAPKAPRVQKAPKTPVEATPPKAAKLPAVAKAPRAPVAPKIPKVQTSQTSAAPKVLKTPKVPKGPLVPKATKTSGLSVPSVTAPRVKGGVGAPRMPRLRAVGSALATLAVAVFAAWLGSKLDPVPGMIEDGINKRSKEIQEKLEAKRAEIAALLEAHPDQPVYANIKVLVNWNIDHIASDPDQLEDAERYTGLGAIDVAVSNQDLQSYVTGDDDYHFFFSLRSDVLTFSSKLEFEETTVAE